MAIISFDFSFKGFSGEGRCGLSIEIPPSGGRPSVVCSQKHDYTGTSITNALERIAHKLYHEVALRELEKRDKNLLEVQSELRTYWKGKSKPLGLGTLYGKSGVRWIEHYPAGTGLASADSFREVLFDARNSPLWLATFNLANAKTQFGPELIEKAFTFCKKE